jgi:hypothetical protein
VFRVPLALAAVMALPSIAAADVRIAVPPALLGGRVAPANPLPPPDPGQPEDADPSEVELSDPEFWSLVWPGAAAPGAAPDDIVMDCDEDANPGSCGLWGDAAATTSLQSVSADPPETTVAVSRALTPPIGTWMTSQTPTLRWAPSAGATHYNIQIYLGPRRVATAWTTRPKLVVPPRVIDQGRYYMWSVWPATGPRSAPMFGEQIGRSVFGVVLRPRIVFRATARGVQGEVRPRIPGAILVMSGPQSVVRHIPKRVRVGANSRFTLGVSRSDAERLHVCLVDPGQKPPKGIRRPVR